MDKWTSSGKEVYNSDVSFAFIEGDNLWCFNKIFNFNKGSGDIE